MRSYVRFDGGPWELIDEYTNLSGNWTNFNLEATIPGGTQTLEFRYAYRLRYYGQYWLDDFVLTTNAYPGSDMPASETYEIAESIAKNAGWTSLSTGGLILLESSLMGDFHSVGDSIDVVIENSTIVGNDARDKDSHGLGLYADYVNTTTNNSMIVGNALDGIHLESLNTDWADEIALKAAEDGVDGTVIYPEFHRLRNHNNGADGIYVNGDIELDATELDVNGNGTDGLDVGANSNLTLTGHASNNGARAIGAQIEASLTSITC